VQRLRHIGKIPHAIDKMQKDLRRWHPTLIGRRPDPGSDEPHVEVVLRLDDGFVWVWLKTAEALRWEGGKMHHCVGNLSHVQALELGNARYYSLRDIRGQPHVTLRACDRKEVEYRGYRNSKAWEFLSAVGALRRAMGWNRTAFERMPDASPRRHRLYAHACFEREMTIPSNLDLSARGYFLRCRGGSKWRARSICRTTCASRPCRRRSKSAAICASAAARISASCRAG
jgi:hypothetical protein